MLRQGCGGLHYFAITLKVQIVPGQPRLWARSLISARGACLTEKHARRKLNKDLTQIPSGLFLHLPIYPLPPSWDRLRACALTFCFSHVVLLPKTELHSRTHRLRSDRLTQPPWRFAGGKGPRRAALQTSRHQTIPHLFKVLLLRHLPQAPARSTLEEAGDRSLLVGPGPLFVPFILGPPVRPGLDVRRLAVAYLSHLLCLRFLAAILNTPQLAIVSSTSLAENTSPEP